MNRRPWHWAVAGLVIMILTSFWAVYMAEGELELYFPWYGTEQDLKVETTSIASLEEYEVRDGYLRVNLQAKEEGSGDVIFSDSEGREMLLILRSVKTRDRFILTEAATGNFSGCQSVVLIMAAFVIYLTLVFFSTFYYHQKDDLYSYATIYYGGLLAYMLGGWVLPLKNAVEVLFFPTRFSMSACISNVAYSASTYLMVSFPVMLFLSLPLAVSNIQLLRKEKFRPRNVLGLVLGVGMILSFTALSVWNGSYFSGGLEELRLITAAQNTVSALVMFFFSLWLSAVVCGFIAAKREPRYDKKYVVILGCRMKADGEPTNLLKARIDRAVDFARKQEAHGGGLPTLILSGGKGKDEPISEAESMHRYLVKEGFPEDHMIIEDKSTNTYQNFLFSTEKAEDFKESSIGFSTNNFHVFRSGLYTRKQGLKAEGMGAKTKWYFWPNAYVREFIGLMVQKKYRIAFWLILIILGAAFSSYSLVR